MSNLKTFGCLHDRSESHMHTDTGTSTSSHSHVRANHYTCFQSRTFFFCFPMLGLYFLCRVNDSRKKEHNVRMQARAQVEHLHIFMSHIRFRSSIVEHNVRKIDPRTHFLTFIAKSRSLSHVHAHTWARTNEHT